MAKTFKPNPMMRVGNAVASTLVRTGLPIGIIQILTVPGRKSGEPRATPLAIIEQDGQRYIIAAYGIVDWVRNLRAAGGGTLTNRGKTEKITVTELSPQDAAPILKATSGAGPGFLRDYYDTNANSALAEFEQESVRHPVFKINPA